jgi:hypothetical protein
MGGSDGLARLATQWEGTYTWDFGLVYNPAKLMPV